MRSHADITKVNESDERIIPGACLAPQFYCFPGPTRVWCLTGACARQTRRGRRRRRSAPGTAGPLVRGCCRRRPPFAGLGRGPALPSAAAPRSGRSHGHQTPPPGHPCTRGERGSGLLPRGSPQNTRTQKKQATWTSSTPNSHAVLPLLLSQGRGLNLHKDE